MWGWTAEAEPRGPDPERKPHVCGDGPVDADDPTVGLAVNPTYVGMDRKIPSPMTQSSSKPHVCGDGPARREELGLTQK